MASAPAAATCRLAAGPRPPAASAIAANTQARASIRDICRPPSGAPLRAAPPHTDRVPDEAFNNWAWRIPFLISFLLVVFTAQLRRPHVFVAVEHANSEVIGIHASRSANRFEALEPVPAQLSSLRSPDADAVPAFHLSAPGSAAEIARNLSRCDAVVRAHVPGGSHRAIARNATREGTSSAGNLNDPVDHLYCASVSGLHGPDFVRNTALHMPSNLLAAFALGIGAITAATHRVPISKRAGWFRIQTSIPSTWSGAIQKRLNPATPVTRAGLFGPQQCARLVDHLHCYEKRK